MFQRWRDYGQRQRAALRESNRPGGGPVEPASPDQPVGPGGPAEPLTTALGLDPAAETTQSAQTTQTTQATRSTGHAEPSRSPYGVLGKPMNRQSPFYIGFFGATGAVIALGLWHALGRLTTTLTLLVVALFLTLALNPLVEALVKRGRRRSTSVALVFVGLLVVFAILGAVVIPPVVQQATELTKAAPDYFTHLADNRWVKQLDKDYGVVGKVQEEVTKKVQDPNFLSSVFGGVLGAGRAVATGVFQGLTVLILTLYFLSSLPRVKQSAYDMVPSTRRPRVISLSEEIMRRVGSYAIGQVAIAAVNALMSWVMMTIVGIPYAAVLAVAVGFLGLVPMVGASLGAVVVCSVAFFDEPRKAVIALVYYVVYQQLENYLVAPRIMQRTVSVPGAVTVVAALAGGTLLGMLGALLAIPFAAGLLLLYEEVLLPRQRHH